MGMMMGMKVLMLEKQYFNINGQNDTFLPESFGRAVCSSRSTLYARTG